MRNNKSKGFSLVETLMVLAIIGVITVILSPFVTIQKKLKNYDVYSINCVKKELAANLTSPACTKSINYCKYKQSNACKTLIFLADHGKLNTSDATTIANSEQTLARKVLGATCDQGGEEACKYFVDSCKKDINKCDMPTAYGRELQYYLELSSTGLTNPGALLIQKYARPYYIANNTNVKEEIINTCQNQITANNPDVVACMFLSEFAESTIRSCDSYTSATDTIANADCKLAYRLSWNRSCNQIKTAWSDATSGIYKITPLGNNTNANQTNAQCDMDTDNGGWTLVLNYLHKGGTNPTPLKQDDNKLPLQGNTTLGIDESTNSTIWGHARIGLMDKLVSDTSYIRFYCRTSNHPNIMHFKTNACNSYFKIGIGDCEGIDTNYTLFPGHSAYVPEYTSNYYSNQGDYAMTEFPFYKANAEYWAISGDGSRWECDDYPNNYNYNTFHQIWVK